MHMYMYVYVQYLLFSILISDLLVKAFLGEYEPELETMNECFFSDPCAQRVIIMYILYRPTNVVL